jgi:hypothetical protein
MCVSPFYDVPTLLNLPHSPFKKKKKKKKRGSSRKKSLQIISFPIIGCKVLKHRPIFKSSSQSIARTIRGECTALPQRAIQKSPNKINCYTWWNFSDYVKIDQIKHSITPHDKSVFLKWCNPVAHCMGMSPYFTRKCRSTMPFERVVLHSSAFWTKCGICVKIQIQNHVIKKPHTCSLFSLVLYE